ncbi:MAG: GNAT family N-acetyltransferase [Myxococcales bacterium]|nr:GNAT family N-acetyltransferase [Myxococcales bacterium]
MESIAWRWATFPDLTLADLYALMALRQRVFVVEQQCAYLDADGRDAGAWHLLLRMRSLVGCLRVIPLTGSDAKPGEHVLGRICTAPEIRRTGLGRELVRRAVARFGDRPLSMSAQKYLLPFYEQFGFLPFGEDYLEDGIPHRKMVRAAVRSLPSGPPP